MLGWLVATCFLHFQPCEVNEKYLLKPIFCSEIQLKSPNWLFGQRKYEENVSSPKVASGEAINEESRDERAVDSFRNLYWISSNDDGNEDDIYQRLKKKKKLHSHCVLLKVTH